MLLHFAKTNAISSDPIILTQLFQGPREEEESTERGPTLFRGV